MRFEPESLQRRMALAVALSMLLAGCSTLPPPENPENLCSIFSSRGSWYEAARKAEGRWGTPVAMQMAIMRHESSYVHDAEPPSDYLFGFIPLGAASSAYGYAQAKEETWDWYREKSGNSGADRDDFADSADFIAWYLAQSRRTLKIPVNDAYNHYLAYHEGQGGFRAKTHQNKPWLLRYARTVARTAQNYAAQMRGCGGRLESARR